MRVIHPVSMNSAVIRPQAMKAPMLGSTMFDRNVPKRWTCEPRPPPPPPLAALSAPGAAAPFLCLWCWPSELLPSPTRADVLRSASL